MGESLKARALFRQEVESEYIDLDKMAEFVWKLYKSIDALWKKKWMGAKALRLQLFPQQQTYSNIMLCLYIIDEAVFYDENEFLNQIKNNSKRKKKIIERKERLMHQQSKDNDLHINQCSEIRAKSVLLSPINLPPLPKSKNKNNASPRKRKRKASVSTKIKKEIPIKKEEIVQIKEELQTSSESESGSESDSSSNGSASSDSESNESVKKVKDRARKKQNNQK